MNAAEPSLCKIEGSPARLRQQMVEISKHGFYPSQVRGSKDILSFLMIDQVKRVYIEMSQIQSCMAEQQETSMTPCFSYDLTPSDSVLRLARRSALRDSSAYSAVSYTWNKNSGWFYEGLEERPKILCEDMSKRRSATPPDFLYRSVAYAVAHGVDSVWIYQECIDQTDPLAKEASIQEMNLVYQESDYPIAVLEFCFHTQAELDVFASVCDDARFTFGSSQIELLESVLLLEVNRVVIR